MNHHIEWIDHNGRPQFRSGSISTVRSWHNHLRSEGVKNITITGSNKEAK